MRSTRAQHTAEALGTFILVLGGCGTAVIAASSPIASVGVLGVAFAFGLALLAAVYALGPISGGHFNPAISIALACAGRFSWSRVATYVAAQLLGAVVAAAVLVLLAPLRPGGYDVAFEGLAANGFAMHSPGGYGIGAALLAELVLTFVFATVVLGATADNARRAQAGIAIGLALTLVHLVGIPITNTSVNPARSTGPALFVGGWALRQLWLFWLAPIAGAALAGLAWRRLETRATLEEEGPAPPITTVRDDLAGATTSSG
jgi:aquaporin Z